MPQSTDEAVISGKEFAMYLFELTVDSHLSQEQILGYSQVLM